MFEISNEKIERLEEVTSLNASLKNELEKHKTEKLKQSVEYQKFKE